MLQLFFSNSPRTQVWVRDPGRRDSVRGSHR